LAKPEYRPAGNSRRQRETAGAERELPAHQDSVVTQAIDALERIGVRRAS